MGIVIDWTEEFVSSKVGAKMRKIYNKGGGSGGKSSFEVNLLSQTKELRGSHGIWGGNWEAT